MEETKKVFEEFTKGIKFLFILFVIAFLIDFMFFDLGAFKNVLIILGM